MFLKLFSGGRKVAQNKPTAAAKPKNALPGRPFKVSDEITIIPQGKNTQANKPKKVNKSTISSFEQIFNCFITFSLP